MKFKDFAYIANIAEKSKETALALAIADPKSEVGRTLFWGFPQALSDHLVPLNRELIKNIHPFGLWRLTNPLSDQGYPIARFVHRNPQNDFKGGG